MRRQSAFDFNGVAGGRTSGDKKLSHGRLYAVFFKTILHDLWNT